MVEVTKPTEAIAQTVINWLSAEAAVSLKLVEKKSLGLALHAMQRAFPSADAAEAVRRVLAKEGYTYVGSVPYACAAIAALEAVIDYPGREELLEALPLAAAWLEQWAARWHSREKTND